MKLAEEGNRPQPLLIQAHLWYLEIMTPKISDEIRIALEKQPDQPLTVRDEQAARDYVILPAEHFDHLQRLVYDDTDLDPAESLPLIVQSFGGPEGWDASGMDDYDDPKFDETDA
jgi:hypothetical protein